MVLSNHSGVDQEIVKIVGPNNPIRISQLRIAIRAALELKTGTVQNHKSCSSRSFGRNIVGSLLQLMRTSMWFPSYNHPILTSPTTQFSADMEARNNVGTTMLVKISSREYKTIRWSWVSTDLTPTWLLPYPLQIEKIYLGSFKEGDEIDPWASLQQILPKWSRGT